jgi:hypothetical protein
MALQSAQLSSSIKSKVQAKNPEYAENIDSQMDWLFDAVAEAVVEHIQSNLEVSGTTAQSCTAGGATGTFTSTSVL